MSRQPFWKQAPWEESSTWGGCWSLWVYGKSTLASVAHLFDKFPSDTQIIMCSDEPGTSPLMRITYDPNAKELILE